MGLLLYKQQTGAFLSNSVQERLRASFERWGSARLIVPSSDAVLLVKRQLGSIQELSVGVNVSTFDEWMRDQWKLYGSSDRLLSNTLRKVFFQQILDGMSADELGTLNNSKGTVELLSKLAPEYLIELDQIMASGQLSAGQMSACKVLERYKKLLEEKSYIETCQCLDYLLQSIPAQGPALVFSRVEDFSEARLQFVRKLSQKRDVTFSLYAPEGPAGYAAEQQLELVGGPGCNCRVDAELASAAKSQELNDLLARVFRAKEGNEVKPSGAVTFLLPLGQHAEAESISRYISQCVESGSKSFVVYTSNLQRVWDALSQKLADKGIAAHYRRSVRIQDSLAGRAFASLIDAYVTLSERAELEKNIDYQASDHQMGDMSWWPPRTLTDYLISPISGISVERAWMLDKSWRGNRTLYATRVLETLSKAAMSSRLCAETIKSLGLGRIGAAAQRIIEHLSAETFDEQSETVQSKELSLQNQESLKVMSKIVSSAQELHEAGLKLTPQTLKSFMDLCKDQAVMMPVSNGIESDVQVLIAPVSQAHSFEPHMFDTVIFQGMDTLNFGVKASDGALQEFVRHASKTSKVSEFARYQRDFYTALSTASTSVAFEKVEQKDVFNAVALSEVKACYPKDYAKKTGVVHGEEEVLVNLLPQASDPERVAELPIIESGEIDPKLKNIVVLPRHLTRETLEQELQDLIEVSREGLPLLSASQIETYLECPYKWFTQRRIKISQVDTEFAPMQMGTFIHRVLELTHATLLAEALGCDVADVDTAVEPVLLQDVAGSRITSDNLDYAKQVLDTSFSQVWDEQFNNINRASSNELIPHSIQERKQVENIRDNLKDLLEFEASHFIGYQPRFFELRFGREENVVEYAGAQFTGSIDRVDVNAHGQALIIDYKHKGTKDLKAYSAKLSLDSEVSKEVLPRHVQSAIYAQIMRKQLTKYKLEPVAAIYLGTKEQKDKPSFALAGMATEAATEHIWNIHPEDKKLRDQAVMVVSQNSAEFADYLDAWENLISQKIQAMLSGDVRANPCDKDACKYCPVKLCDKRR
ncbi:PD-(D/E)XK nuclease family protein [Lancefieldella parvula]|uniref:PD-(D/E)XK nuclease family protein n=1 Tax=Lancefieldella parvula TaxID=1382 RepID=UPI00288B5434|nr:PD-(D/E)XK nuclease family protein [Lancefieldella parvula]